LGAQAGHGSKGHSAPWAAIDCCCCGLQENTPNQVARTLLRAVRSWGALSTPPEGSLTSTEPSFGAAANLSVVDMLSTLSIVIVLDGRQPWDLLVQLRRLVAFATAVIRELCALAAPETSSSDGPAPPVLALLQARVRALVQTFAKVAAAPSHPASQGGAGPRQGPCAARLHCCCGPGPQSCGSSGRCSSRCALPPLRAGELTTSPGAPLLVALRGLSLSGTAAGGRGQSRAAHPWAAGGRGHCVHPAAGGDDALLRGP